MPDCFAPLDTNAAGALIRRLENALAEQSRHVLFADDDWRRTTRLYTPVLEDLLGRALRSQSMEEIRFLAQQADRLLELCSLNAGKPLDEPSASAREIQVLSLPLTSLRRRTAHLAQCLAHPDCQRDLHRVLGAPVAASRVTSDDLVLRALARVLLQGWGARDIVSAPIPARGRPQWDLYATELKLVVRARPRAQSAFLLTFAPYRLIVARSKAPASERLEARLCRDPMVDQPVSWTGLRWDEEQRLRAAGRLSPERGALSLAARRLQRALARLESHFVQMLAQNPPSAPWTWRPSRSRLQ